MKKFSLPPSEIIEWPNAKIIAGTDMDLLFSTGAEELSITPVVNACHNHINFPAQKTRKEYIALAEKLDELMQQAMPHATAYYDTSSLLIHIAPLHKDGTFADDNLPALLSCLALCNIIRAYGLFFNEPLEGIVIYNFGIMALLQASQKHVVSFPQHIPVIERKVNLVKRILGGQKRQEPGHELKATFIELYKEQLPTLQEREIRTARGATREIIALGRFTAKHQRLKNGMDKPYLFDDNMLRTMEKHLKEQIRVGKVPNIKK